MAPVPYLSGIVGGALPVARFGTDAQRARLLPGVIDGSATLTIALYEPDEVEPAVVPVTQARPSGDGWRLDGAPRRRGRGA